MTAVDTNVVIRLLRNDDAAQVELARELFQSDVVWIGKTVLLEAAWVLKFSYDYQNKDIHAAFVRFLGLDNVKVEDVNAVTRALGLMMEGVDFPDAIHTCARPSGSQFATMDEKFALRARSAGDLLVKLLK